MITEYELIESAIARAGGVSALARHLGVTQPSVSMWRARRRLPSGWAAFLREKLADPGWPARQPAPSMTAEAA